MAQIHGKVKLAKITNNTCKSLHFKNPYNGKEGSIAPGQTKQGDCEGLIPSWRSPKRYEITYYNEKLNKQVLLRIKDVEDVVTPYAISFGNDNGCKPETEHISAILPQPCNCNNPNFEIKFDGYGYLIYNGDTKECVSACRFWN